MGGEHCDGFVAFVHGEEGGYGDFLAGGGGGGVAEGGVGGVSRLGGLEFGLVVGMVDGEKRSCGSGEVGVRCIGARK